MMQSILTQFEAYLLTEKRVALHTFSAYKRDIVQFVDFLTSQQIALENSTADDIKLFLKHLKENAIGARSMARKISSLKVFFSWAHGRFGWHNNAADLVFPKIEKRLPKYLSETEVERLLSVAALDATPLGKRNNVMVYLLYVTGLRVSELISLSVSAISYDDGVLRLTGKGGKDRVVPLPEAIFPLLRDYIDGVRNKLVPGMNAHEHTNDLLFPSMYAGKVQPITRQTFWMVVRNLCRKAGIERAVSPHQLRHSLATHLLKNGANLRSLQLLLGHEYLATVQIYTHVETGYLRSMYDKKHPRS